VVLLMVVVDWDGRDGGGELLMVEADDLPPARPPLLPARSDEVGPKSASISVAAIAASGVIMVENMRDAATMEDPMAFATPLLDMWSSVEAFAVGAGANAADGAADIAKMVAASPEILTMVNCCLRGLQFFSRE